MTGAETLVETLLNSGVSVCFANPGTSEMHFVAALDSHPEMRAILCTFEGGASGAADGYARMTGQPACTLLHLGPGFGNAWSNLHNARKGHSSVVNIVGDHATYHLKYDAPLTSDLDGVAGSVSHWLRRAGDADAVGEDAAAAVRAARSHGGQIATLVLPADASWSETASRPEIAAEPPARYRPLAARVAAAAEALARPGSALLLDGGGVCGPGAELAGRIAARTGCRLIAPYFAARIAAGAGSTRMGIVPYPLPEAMAFFSGLERIVCLGAGAPVAFFAYPGQPSSPAPADCAIDTLCPPEWDVDWTLGELARLVGVDGSETVEVVERVVPEPASGRLTPDGIGRALARHLPEGAIVANEAITAGVGIAPHLFAAAAHDRLNNTGGSIGLCLPAAMGAAVACPDRSVFALSGDGSALYQVQSLWTMAREELDVTVIIMANRSYQILHGELAAMGHLQAGRNAMRVFDLVEPTVDWVSVARGFGVAGARAETAEAFSEALDVAADTKGPFLIEAVI